MTLHKRLRGGLWIGIVALVCAGAALAQPLDWKQLPGTGNDIGVGANGAAWLVGTNPVPGGFGIYRWNGSAWDTMPGGAVRIDVDPQGNPWVVNNTGAIYQWSYGTWKQVPGLARDIGIGANGAVWVIGTNAEVGGYGIFRWAAIANTFEKISGSALRIDVDPAGNAWVVNNKNEIFRYTMTKVIGMSLPAFVQVPGSALDIGIGADGSVFIVGTDHGVYKWNGSSWIKRDGVLDSVSVDPKGNPWGVNSAKAIFAAGGAVGGNIAPPKPGDMTAKIEDLGIPNQGRYPTRERIYARNPWSMKAFQGRIYIGSGNSNNEGPAPNAGPVDIVALDPKTGKYTIEWTVPDEQIDEFRIIGSTLVIPGHDPKEAWTYGNFYVRAAAGGWSKVRTIKGGIHMYDLIQRSAAPLKGGTLGGVDQAAFAKQFMYAALGTPVGAVVGVSSDFGKSWDEHPMLGTYRARTFLSGLNDMCVSTSGSRAFLVTPSGVSPLNVNLFPGVPDPGGALFAVKPAAYQGTAYYLGAYAPIDHNWKAVGMFATTDCRSVRHLALPAQTPHDLLVYQGTLYVLASDIEGAGQRVRVFATTNGSTFTEVLNFLSTTFARSFEIVDGDFFFALGSEAESLHPDTGRIVRIRGVLK